jgi:hypothetical protein
MRETRRAALLTIASPDSAGALGLDRCQGLQAIGPDGRVGVAGVADVVSVRRDRERVMVSRNPIGMSAGTSPDDTGR